MIKKLSHKVKSDEGATVTVLGLFIIITIILVGMFMIDLSKNSYLSSIQRRNTQMAAQIAIKEQGGTGYLKLTAVNRAIREYNTLRNGEEGTNEFNNYASNNPSSRTSCQLKGDYPKITVTLDTTRTYSTSEKALTYSTIAGRELQQSESAISSWNAYMNNQPPENQYKVVQIKVVDSVDNFLLGMIGMPCSELITTSSAITSTTFDDEILE